MIGPNIADALRVIPVVLAPVALAAAVDTTEVQYTVPGIEANDVVVGLAGPAPGLHVGICGFRAIAPNIVAILWGNFTAAANVPPSGTYTFLVLRFK